jgi:molybdenum cofactor cytidylyltransferase
MLPHSKSQIGAVILAAGGSSRFGQPKQLLPFRGKTLVRRIVDAATQAGCSPVIVVVGSDREKVIAELSSTNAVIVENDNWQRGIGSSIRSGIRGLIKSTPDVDAAVLLVCDQPAVDARVIQRLVKLRETTNESVIASRYADTLGVPAIFDRSFFLELLSLDNEIGAKSIILRNRDRVIPIAFAQGDIDVDSRHDWEKLGGETSLDISLARSSRDG